MTGESEPEHTQRYVCRTCGWKGEVLFSSWSVSYTSARREVDRHIEQEHAPTIELEPVDAR